MTAEEILAERARAALRMARLYDCEANGLMCAGWSPNPVVWSQNPDEQRRFLVGFEEGKAILAAHQPATAKTV